MKVAVFSTKPYDRQFLEAANTDYGHDLRFFEPRLNHETSTLAAGYAAVCVFVNGSVGRFCADRTGSRGNAFDRPAMRRLQQCKFNRGAGTGADRGAACQRIRRMPSPSILWRFFWLSSAGFTALITAYGKATSLSMDCWVSICTVVQSGLSVPAKSAQL